MFINVYIIFLQARGKGSRLKHISIKQPFRFGFQLISKQWTERSLVDQNKAYDSEFQIILYSKEFDWGMGYIV